MTQTALPDVLQTLEARRALLAGMVAALAAPDDHGDERFEAALADPAAQWWPFDLARAHLLFGERLRRDRQIARARRHLAEALTAFIGYIAVRTVLLTARGQLLPPRPQPEKITTSEIPNEPVATVSPTQPAGTG